MTHHRGNKSETGAALITSLVLLIFITILATVSLKTASLGELTSRNYFEKVLTFQAAESAVEETLSDLDILRKATLLQGTALTEVVDQTGQHTNAQVSYTYLGDAPVQNWSLNATGSGSSRFQIVSDGTIPDTGARTTTEHGYIRINPPTGG